MFGMSVTFVDETKRVKDAAKKAAFKNFTHAAARIMKDAKSSIVTSEAASEEGKPPHTRARAGHNLRSAIRFDATKEDAVIGPMASIVGESGRAHELGEDFHGQSFPERPFMWPALLNNVDRFAQEWAGSIEG